MRELRHVMERALVLCQGSAIGLDHLPDHIRAAALMPPEELAEPANAQMRESVGGLERAMLMRALEQAGQNRTQAAALLGISRRTLYEKMAKHGVGRGRS